MPNFYVDTYLSPVTPISTRIWGDPTAVTRPSRLTSFGDRQHRYLRVPPSSAIRLYAIVTGDTTPRPDSTVGPFSSWCIEYPAPSYPVKSYPTAGYSSVSEWVLENIGHYLLAVRREDDGSPVASAGGVVLIHIDVTGS